MDCQRYAIYYAPRPSRLARAAAAWLGWDATGGPAPAEDGMPTFPPAVTEAPRRYGFHGTLKAPFRLAPGCSPDDLLRAMARLAAGRPRVLLPALTLQHLGDFLALAPEGEASDLAALSAEVVRQMEPFRAPLDAAEIARRNPERLTERQRANLRHWGYPHVMEDFRFHLTLTGPLGHEEIGQVAAALDRWLVPLVPRPFPIEDLCLFGEGADGRFRLLARHALTG